MLQRHLVVAAVIIIATCPGGFAMQQADIPSAEPEDAIMAGSAEVAEISDWVRACFAG